MHEPADAAIDPITLEIIWNGLKSIDDESYIAHQKSAFSTNIKERHDHSTAIADARGRLIAQAEKSLPIHLASMLGLMRILVARYGDDIAEGDIFIANDPHVAGGTHLPDINMAMPVFADGRLVGFVCNIAHHADVGGIARGSMSGGMSEIYQEGLRIPVMRLYRARRARQRPARPAAAQRARAGGAPRRLFRADRRLPAGRRAHAAAVRPLRHADGRGRLRRRSSTARPSACAPASRAIPDGSYRFEDVIDDDGLKERNVKFALEVAQGRRAHRLRLHRLRRRRCRATSTSRSTRCSPAVLLCAESAARSGPAEQSGAIDAVEIVAPAGTVANCVAPGRGRAAGQHLPARHRRRHRRAAPTRCPSRRSAPPTAPTPAWCSPASTRAAARPTSISRRSAAAWAGATTGRQGRRAGAHHQHVEPAGRGDRDGVSAAGRGATRWSTDSGGAGRFRGGMGLRRIVRPVGHTCEFNGVGRALSSGAVGHLRRRARAQRALPAAASRTGPCRRCPRRRAAWSLGRTKW